MWFKRYPSLTSVERPASRVASELWRAHLKPGSLNRSTLRRLELLEQKAPQDTGKWHTILVASDEEEERETVDLKASSKWTEGDNLMVIRLMAGERGDGTE